MRRGLALCLVLMACGPTDQPGPEPHPTRQQPSVTEPGLHVSGYASVGVMRKF